MEEIIEVDIPSTGIKEVADPRAPVIGMALHKKELYSSKGQAMQFSPSPSVKASSTLH